MKLRSRRDEGIAPYARTGLGRKNDTSSVGADALIGPLQTLSTSFVGRGALTPPLAGSSFLGIGGVFWGELVKMLAIWELMRYN